VAVSGLNEAIGSGNLQILYVFHCLKVGDRLTRETLKWTLHNAGGDKVEVVLRVMMMFMDKENWEAGNVLDAELSHLSGAGQQRRPDGSSWVETVKARWDNIWVQS
jgi:hypothetical protein